MRQWFLSRCKIFGLIHHPDHSPNISQQEIELHFSLSILLVRYAIDRSIGLVPETSGRCILEGWPCLHPQWPTTLKQSPLDRHPTAKAFIGRTSVTLSSQLMKPSSLQMSRTVKWIPYFTRSPGTTLMESQNCSKMSQQGCVFQNRHSVPTVLSQDVREQSLKGSRQVGHGFSGSEVGPVNLVNHVLDIYHAEDSSLPPVKLFHYCGSNFSFSRIARPQAID